MENNIEVFGWVNGEIGISATQSENPVPVARFSLAEKVYDKNEENKSRTQWHNCCAFGRLAERIGNHVSSGTMICVRGHLNVRNYKDRYNQARRFYEIVVREFEILRRRKDTPSMEDKANPVVSVAAEKANAGDAPVSAQQVQTHIAPSNPFARFEAEGGSAV